MMTEELSERERKLADAMQSAIIAIDDWLNLYAEDMCDAKRVREARERIRDEGGTLAYIASIQDKNRDALAQYAPKPKPVPVLPDYDSLTLHQKDWIAISIFNWRDTVGMKTSDVYNAIREITAKVPD